MYTCDIGYTFYILYRKWTHTHTPAHARNGLKFSRVLKKGNCPSRAEAGVAGKA